MSVICPTVLADNAHTYREQMERIAPFADRVQIDLADGVFASRRSIDLDQVWWPEHVQADIHLMFKTPVQHIDQLIKLRPNMVIVHAESDGNFFDITKPLKLSGIKVGVALLKPTLVNTIAEVLDQIDHTLIFSGDLGHFGGVADLGLLQKVRQIKSIAPGTEIGWDGGVNADNAKDLLAGGVDVLNVGGYIQQSADPQAAYAKLKEAIYKRKINVL